MTAHVVQLWTLVGTVGWEWGMMTPNDICSVEQQ